MIRLAKEREIDQIEEIYAAINENEERGISTIGWNRSIYPTRKTAWDAWKRNDLFVLEEQRRIVAAAIINQMQVPEYAACEWEYQAKDTEVMVLHTLVVDPRMKSRGYGSRMVHFYEAYALEQKCLYLRMDTQVQNQAARQLYAKLGYKEPGIVTCSFNGIPNVEMVCLEKRIHIHSN